MEDAPLSRRTWEDGTAAFMVLAYMPLALAAPLAMVATETGSPAGVQNRIIRSSRSRGVIRKERDIGKPEQ